ncbi:hypothetical protein [Streptomyces sp. NPDC058045]|uniref:hypothetical protein n=1 Tax=Streptomyces sp. NPDC058045 TaxID=3346311 RepID=UPI0036E0E0C9
MDTQHLEKLPQSPPAADPVRGTWRPGTVRTCIPARTGRAGYREPEEPDGNPQIVRGED